MRSSPLLKEPVNFPRLGGGAVFTPGVWEGDLPLSGLPAWQSNGGPHRGHPARSLPLSIEIPLLENPGALVRMQLIGVFALFASPEHETSGTLGASIQFLGQEGQEFRHDLLNGRHYCDAFDLDSVRLRPGDGTSLETVGSTEIGGRTARVDLLTIDVPSSIQPTSIRFRDLGSPASFLLFDAFAEREVSGGCPFHSRGGGISLGEISSIVRVGDRVRLCQALDQLTESLLRAHDIDDARGQTLTFLSMVIAATMEMGASRSMHRVQLDAARELEKVDSLEEIATIARKWVEHVASGLLGDPATASSHLIDRALEVVERNYARELSDVTVAEQLGLSNSHFRYLFKQATGQPFHKYVVSVRLEKARAMLLNRDMAVGEVAHAVGFAGLSHFSRAFAQRFNVSPTSTRNSSLD